MTYCSGMVVDIVCGKCNAKIGSMKFLQSIKKASGVIDGKCPVCGHGISTSDFTLDVESVADSRS